MYVNAVTLMLGGNDWTAAVKSVLLHIILYSYYISYYYIYNLWELFLNELQNPPWRLARGQSQPLCKCCSRPPKRFWLQGLCGCSSATPGKPCLKPLGQPSRSGQIYAAWALYFLVSEHCSLLSVKVLSQPGHGYSGSWIIATGLFEFHGEAHQDLKSSRKPRGDKRIGQKRNIFIPHGGSLSTQRKKHWDTSRVTWCLQSRTEECSGLGRPNNHFTSAWSNIEEPTPQTRTQ